VCRESREEAKRYYKLTFGIQGREPHVYFDFNIDTAHSNPDKKRICGWLLLNSQIRNGDSFDKIKKMRVSYLYIGNSSPVPQFLSFTGLEEIRIGFDSLNPSDNSREKRDEFLEAFEATRLSLRFHFWNFPTLVLSDGKEMETYVWPELVLPDNIHDL